MKQLFSIKSPLWQIIAASFLYVILLLIIHDAPNDQSGLTPTRVGLLIGAAAVLLYTVIYIISVITYNKKHPDHRLSVTGIKPPEILDEDEGMNMLTARATKRVYRYHAFALPFLAVFITIIEASLTVVVTALFIATIIHYLVYWHAIWPAFQDTIDEE